MNRRFFDAQDFITGTPAQLGGDTSHHISRVLRMGVGDALTVFNGKGGEWYAQIAQIDKKSVTVIPHSFNADNRTPPLAIDLALPLIKGDRMDVALQKATELGVRNIYLIRTAREEVRVDGERLSRKFAHWQQVIVSACEQCGLNLLPALHAPAPLADVLKHADVSHKLIAHPGRTPLSHLMLQPNERVLIVTGPEGGFTDDELAIAHALDCKDVTLGHTVLRAETAPLALMAALIGRVGAS